MRDNLDKVKEGGTGQYFKLEGEKIWDYGSGDGLSR